MILPHRFSIGDMTASQCYFHECFFIAPSGHIQLKVDSIHNLLRQQIADDALCLIGLTMVDLYEDDPDLFVAGLAAGNQRVAVSITNQHLISPLGFSM